MYDDVSNKMVKNTSPSGLRLPPIADATALTAIVAVEYNKVLQKDTKAEYVFKLTVDLTV